MASRQETLSKQIIDAIQNSIEKFNRSVPGIQRQIASEMELLVKDLEIKNGNITGSVKNLRTIGQIKSKLEKIIFSPEYKNAVRDFIKSFDEITKLQSKYFEAASDKYSKPKVLEEIRNQSVNATLEYLTEAGINANVTQKVQDILRQNIVSGAKFTDLTKQLRSFIVNDAAGLGALERYAKQITNDALNQYAASVNDAVTNDLGLEWFEYTGVITETSRCFCESLIKKRWVHISEIPKIVKGDFEEFKAADCEINSKTKLPEGMIAGTNAQNFKIYRGGHKCNHQLLPISEIRVPEIIRTRFK